MAQEDLPEWPFLLLALLYLAIAWIYKRLRAWISRRRSQMPIGNFASRTPTLTEPTSRSLRRVATPSALGSFFGVLFGSLVFASWVSSQVPVPANVARAAAYVPVWLCIGAPMVSAFSAVFVTIADNAFREFQAKPLPRGLPFVLGALIGLVFTLVSAGISLTTPCLPFEPC